MKIPLNTMTDPLNAAMLLYMLDRAAPVYGRTKIQKTPFLVELELQKAGIVGPTFPYKRYLNGPFSQEVWTSLDYLVATGFLREEDYGPTERGLFLVDIVETLREGNQEAFKIIDAVLRHCRSRGGARLMQEIYSLEMRPAGLPDQMLRIEDVPQETALLEPSSPTLAIPSGFIELIEDELTLTDEALEDARRRIDEINERQVKRILG